MLYGNCCGYLYENLRNRARKKCRLHDENGNGNGDGCENLEEESNFDELMQFFKNCVVAQQKDELKMKLTECVEYCRRILANTPEPIYKMFGFYFVDPELVNMFLFLLVLFCSKLFTILTFYY